MVFLTDTTLKPGTPLNYDAGLQIQRTPPEHLDEASDLARDAKSSWTFKWRLLASVNVVRGRDPKSQRTVKVRLLVAPNERRIGSEITMSNPKKSTRPSS